MLNATFGGKMAYYLYPKLPNHDALFSDDIKPIVYFGRVQKVFFFPFWVSCMISLY